MCCVPAVVNGPPLVHVKKKQPAMGLQRTESHKNATLERSSSLDASTPTTVRKVGRSATVGSPPQQPQRLQRHSRSTLGSGPLSPKASLSPTSAAEERKGSAGAAVGVSRKGSLKRRESMRASPKNTEQTHGMVFGGEATRHFEKVEQGQRKILKQVLETPLEPVRSTSS